MMKTLEKMNNLMGDMARSEEAVDINMNYLERLASLFREYLQRQEVIHPASRNGFNEWWEEHEPFCCKSIDDEKNLAADAYNAGFNVLTKLFEKVVDNINFHEEKMQSIKEHEQSFAQRTNGILRAYRYTLRMIEKLQKSDE